MTCTDLAVLCGSHNEACYAKYGVMSLRGTEYCHEMVSHCDARIFMYSHLFISIINISFSLCCEAIRIALATIQFHAARHKRIAVPLLSIHADFYIRLFLRLYTSGQETKKLARFFKYNPLRLLSFRFFFIFTFSAYHFVTSSLTISYSLPSSFPSSFLSSKMSYIYQCSQCATFWLQPVGKVLEEV